MIKTLDNFNRRDVLMAGAATAISLGISPQAWAQAAPKRGGRMRLGVAGANSGDSHDPATWGTSAIINYGLWCAGPSWTKSWKACPWPLWAVC